MWQCSHCAEELEDTFDTCWKCGTDSTGTFDPEFEVSEPATREDQLPIAVDASQLPVLRLPSVTYLYIPVFLLLSVASLLYGLRTDSLNRSPRPLSTTGIVLLVITTVLISVPVGFEMIRGWYAQTSRKQRGGGGLSEDFWILSMFRLPEALHGRFCWFAVLYYGSIVVYTVVPLVVIIWQVVEMTSDPNRSSRCCP